MTDDLEKSLRARPEQLVYASILEKGMLFGLLLVLVTYCLYVFGAFQPYVPMADIPKCWTMNVHDYLDHCKIHAGWAWLGMLKYSDFLNFLGIALLAGVTVICFLAVIPVLWRGGDKLYAGFALLEAVILSVAASGILGSGGH
ncbi:MAG: hypothetical protein AB1646_17920 [Thermodesulfobacteriota bacterium]